MINVIDEVLNTGATENKVKYTLTHADGTTELVQLDLATPVTTVGTPLNRELFNSIQSFLMTSTTPQTFNVTAKASNTGDATQTFRMTTAGRRYYLFTFTGTTPSSNFALYDAQANLFIIGGYFGRLPDDTDNTFATNVNSLIIKKNSSGGGNATITLTCSLSGTTLTINAIKHTNSSVGTPAMTITVNELGGFLL